ncbi:MAG TPA: PQQ-dependent sugar dehydrogenase [Kofleriaceae bacterium]|jgi:hypothetical protein
MKKVAFVVALLAACGGGSDKHDAGPTGDDDAGGSGSDAGPNPQCVPDALPACANPVAGTKLTFRKIGGQFGDAAVLVTSPPNDARAFVVQRNGQIKIIDNEVTATTPFFDLNNYDDEFVSETGQGERGLLSMAFHPEYKCNGEFFIYYTTSVADVIARCTVSSDANVANPTCTTVLAVPDPYENHNGGMMEFGRDGYLYVGIGDGGSGGDPKRNAQSLTPKDQGGSLGSTALLGKFLRIDIDHKDAGKEYGIPSSNPYAAGGGEPEIWMVGVRNPWRWSFDKPTGDIYIGDVGQGVTEEIDVLKAGEQAGKNLGWSVWEANSCCSTQSDKCTQSGAQQTCDMNAPGLVFPVDTHSHSPDGWISVIGGEVYHGTCMPDLAGTYFYTDWQSANAKLRRATLNAGGTLDFATDFATNPSTVPNNISSIHADARGELWATTAPPNNQGGVYKIETTP